MKHLLIITVLLAAMATTCAAQKIEYVDDEECGCSLVFVDGIQTTTDGEFFGFKLADGTVIVPNKFRYVDQFHGDYCKVYLDYGQCGMIDRTGKQIIPCNYDDVEYPSCGRIRVTKNDLNGYCDLEGHEIVPPSYRLAGPFSENLAPVLIDIDSFSVAFTFIDTMGRQTLKPIYENLSIMIDGYAAAQRYSRWGIIDRNGREMLPFMYEYITMPMDGFFFAGDSLGMALFDYRFKPLTKFVYSNPGPLSEGRISVMRDGLYGYLNTNGKEVIPCQYTEASPFKESRAKVAKGKKFGIINASGKAILPLEYEDATPHGDKYIYHDGLALVEKDGKLGFVDIDGKLVIPYYFDQAFHFTQGLACVRFNGMWGYIDTKGDVYMPFVFDYASPFEWGRAEVVYNGTVSNVDLRGKCVKNCNGVIAWRNWKE